MTKLNVPIEEIYSHPVVQELLEKANSTKQKDLENVKIPYILKDKILMSPGVWNDFFYSASAIHEAYVKTNWSEKENRNLFLDHADRSSREWIGEVINPRMSGENIIGDLVVVDKPTAQKLEYGAKMGISPKVHGEEEDNCMMSFLFDNFSVVINPAVKTAYINNAEKKKEPYGKVDYADPGYKGDKKKYPIDTKEHVKAAWSYINMPKNQKDYTADQVKSIKTKIKSAAKKFGISIKEVNQMTEEIIKNDETGSTEDPKVDAATPEAKPDDAVAGSTVSEKKVEEEKVESTMSENKDYNLFVIDYIKSNPSTTPEQLSEAWKNKDAVSKESVTMSESDIVSQIMKLASMLGKPESAEMIAEKKMLDIRKESKNEVDKLSSTVQEMSEQISTLTKKLNTPVRATKKTEELSQDDALKYVQANPDEMMGEALLSMCGGGL